MFVGKDNIALFLFAQARVLARKEHVSLAGLIEGVDLNLSKVDFSRTRISGGTVIEYYSRIEVLSIGHVAIGGSSDDCYSAVFVLENGRDAQRRFDYLKSNHKPIFSLYN